MARSTIRVLLDNRLSKVNASTTANSLNDYRSKYDTGTTFTLATDIGLTGTVAVIAVLTDAETSVTMTVTGQGSTTDITTSSFTGQTVGYGAGKYIAKYFTLDASTSSFTVTFSTTVKVSRFIVGNYWAPKYDVGFGMQVGYQDASVYERSMAGDQLVTLAPRYKQLSFNLELVDPTDKLFLYKLFRIAGKSIPLFVSLFPEDADNQKEQYYSIYGKLSEPGSLSYAKYNAYSAGTISLEEV